MRIAEENARRAALARGRYAADPTNRRAANRKWQKANPERVREGNKAWREANPDYIRAANDAWKAAHPDLHNAAIRAWKAANPDKVRSSGHKAGLNRRARERGAFVESVNPVAVYERDGGICGICGQPIDGKWEVDHIIPISRGGIHAYANVQLAHPRCNNKKGAKVA